MSVVKSLRGESAMQFVETARKLEAHTLSICMKAPKRYTPFLTAKIMELASTVHNEVRSANSFLIMEKTKHYFKTLFGFYPNKKGWEYMLSIIKNGNALATVNTPTYVKMHENGSYVLCPEVEAEGVVVDGVVFHIIGRPAMEGTEDVFLEETDETHYQVKSKEERDAKTTELEDAIADLTMLIASTMM